MPEYADGIEKLSIEALECRDLGHAWRKVGKRFDVVRDARGRVILYSRRVKCDRCGLPRVDEYDRGQVRSRNANYDYNAVEGYRLKPGSGYVRGFAARSELAEREGDLDDWNTPPPPIKQSARKATSRRRR